MYESEMLGGTLLWGSVMRIAIISDIHGNRAAFEAVLADLRQTSPDLILHGGDLADNGSSPVEIVDRIRSLCWQGVLGNTDEMLGRPESLREFARQSTAMQPLLPLIEDMAEWTREALGPERLAWLRSLPLLHKQDELALVHASPETPWRAPLPTASDAELESVYARLDRPVVVYGHIHRPYIRKIAGQIVANAGSVSLSHDGDRRAAYLIVDGTMPVIRRVEYDVEKEIAAVTSSGLPHADWVSKMLQSGAFQMP
jgi:putative phosphoesterase